MKYRLEAPHYIDDMYLETGTEVGDGCGVPFRFARDSNTVRPDGQRVIVKAGDRMIPSIAMFPLDKEAEEEYKAKFGATPPNRDPLERIPIMPNVKTSENTQPSPGSIPGAKGPTANPAVTPARVPGQGEPKPPESSNKPPVPPSKDGPVPGGPDNSGPKG